MLPEIAALAPVEAVAVVGRDRRPACHPFSTAHDCKVRRVQEFGPAHRVDWGI